MIVQFLGPDEPNILHRPSRLIFSAEDIVDYYYTMGRDFILECVEHSGFEQHLIIQIV
jgi:hypothetical protein